MNRYELYVCDDCSDRGTFGSDDVTGDTLYCTCVKGEYEQRLDAATFHAGCVQWARVDAGTRICPSCWSLAERKFGRDHSARTLQGWIADTYVTA